MSGAGVVCGAEEDGVLATGVDWVGSSWVGMLDAALASRSVREADSCF